MRKVLHLLTRPEETWPARFIELEKSLPNTEHEVMDLRSGTPDYRAVVERIFSSDSVQVW
ncbi:MAG: hypothetical protein N3J91_04910 [Verrucomicrobiae bacterium]|nr:hypothetical protein [Verrucomicrobiae bacterium]